MKINKQELINIIKEEIDNEVKHLNEYGLDYDPFSLDAMRAKAADDERSMADLKKKKYEILPNLRKRVEELEKLIKDTKSSLVSEPGRFAKFTKAGKQQISDRAAGQERIKQLEAELEKTRTELKGVVAYLDRNRGYNF